MKPKTVDEFIAMAPEAGQEKLIELRKILKSVAPKATEAIKWGHLVFEEKRILFAYSAYRDHINFMPTGPSLEPFRKEVAEAGLEMRKDTIRLYYAKPIPKSLIKKIAEYRAKDVRENDAKWMYR